MKPFFDQSLLFNSVQYSGAQLVEFRGRRSLWFFFAYASALGGAATLDGERLGGQLPVRGAQPHQMLLRRPAAGSRGPASDARRPGSAERRHEYVPTDRRNDKMTSKSRIPKSARTGEAHGTGDRDSFDSASGAGNGAKIAFKFAKLNAADGKTREHENRLKIGGPPGTACAQHSLTVDPFS